MKPDRDRIPGVPVPCNYCQAKIMWLRTEQHRLMPLDAYPDPAKGNVRRDGDLAIVLGQAAAAAQRAAGVPLRLHHAASCPFADRWRSGPKRSSTPRTAPATPAAPAEGGLW